MKTKTMIKVEHLNKSFRLPLERSSSVKNALINFSRGKRGYEIQHVLEDISFEINQGDFFGIVGRNGSGKSTLLKLLAGIYTPSKGNITINGKLTPFIELGVGFNMELTGRENVYLNGALLGFSRKEMNAMYDEIVEFAELHRFMDQKLKNYSSGMQVRLAFSIAIRAKSEILLLDEVLAVGDANFQKKCFDVFKQIKEEGRTVILVTHDMTTVQNYCTSAMLLNDGKIVTIGATNKVTKQYNDLNVQDLESKDTNNMLGSNRGAVSITKVWMQKGESKSSTLTPEDGIDFHFQYRVNEDISEPVIGITLQDQVGRPVFAINTTADGVPTGRQKAGEVYDVNFKIENIYSDGNYYIVPAITNTETSQTYDVLDEGYRFTILGWPYPAYITQPKHSIGISKKKAENE